MTTAPPWIGYAVRGLPQPEPGMLVLLLDPRAILVPGVDPGWQWYAAKTRWQLRRVYETDLRHRAGDAAAVLLHVTDPELRRPEDLPWDLSRLPVALVDPALPNDVIEALPDIADSAVAAAVANASRIGYRVGPIIGERMLGVALPAPDGAAELTFAIRAHTAGLTAEVRHLLAPEIASPLARDAIGSPTPAGPLASAWRDWCDEGSASDHHQLFSQCGASLLTLVEAGVLAPPESIAPGLPAWVRAAARLGDPTPAVRDLLSARPGDLPTDFEGWTQTATWWARIRWACATGAVDPEVVENAWGEWERIDSAFLDWVHAHYARELSRIHLPPRTVDKIAPFLVHQMRRRRRPQALVVMDGMGIAQWNQLRAATGAAESDRHLVMAAIPTVTQVSRQAIFAGRPPAAFPTSVQSPAEGRLWREFWTGQGVPPEQIQYVATNGRVLPTIRDAQAIGLVVNAVDEAMHGVGGYGDVGFRDLVARFAESGFMGSLVDLAQTRGWDLWFTADHGNLPCRGLQDTIPQQGLRVRSRGKRVWTYQTADMRARREVPGIEWDPPGYPQEGGYPLFAVGRTCYERDAVLVSHGGLSIDEVFVPLVRVET